MTKKQKTWLIAAQVGVSLGMLAWLFYVIVRDNQLGDILKGWHSLSPFWIVGALLAVLLSFLFATFRWQLINRSLHIYEPGRQLFSHFMAGQFVSSFLPTTIGGDVLRVTRLSSDTKSPQRSFASVVLDRFCGWPILGIISLLGFLVNPGLIKGVATTAIFISLGTIAAFLIIAYIATHENVGQRLRNSQGVFKYLNAIHLGLSALVNDVWLTLKVIVSTFAMQFAAIAAAGMAVEAVSIHEIGFSVLMAYLPPILIIQVLPVSIGGFGVREAAFVVVFNTIGVEEVQSLQLGLLLGFMTLVVSLIGAPALAFGGIKKREHATS